MFIQIAQVFAYATKRYRNATPSGRNLLNSLSWMLCMAFIATGTITGYLTSIDDFLQMKTDQCKVSDFEVIELTHALIPIGRACTARVFDFPSCDYSNLTEGELCYDGTCTSTTFVQDDIPADSQLVVESIQQYQLSEITLVNIESIDFTLNWHNEAIGHDFDFGCIQLADESLVCDKFIEMRSRITPYTNFITCYKHNKKVYIDQPVHNNVTYMTFAIVTGILMVLSMLVVGWFAKEHRNNMFSDYSKSTATIPPGSVEIGNY